MNEYKDITNIIQEYRKEWGVVGNEQNFRDGIIQKCESSTSLTEAIKLAAEGLYESKKTHPHHRRVGRLKLREFAIKLASAEKDLSSNKTFDEILQTVSKNRIRGIGQLTSYDIALRIGAYKKIWPDKIYLHAGTKQGAKVLLGKTIRGKKYLTLEDLPEEYRNHNLSCHQWENFFCVKKHKFKTYSDIGNEVKGCSALPKVNESLTANTCKPVY